MWLMFLVGSIIKLLQRFVPVLILFAAIVACCAETIIWGPPPPPPPPPNLPPLGPFTTDQYTPVFIPLPGAEGVSYWATASAGAAEIQDDVLTYTPDTNLFFQGASILLSAQNNSDAQSVSEIITILPAQPIISFTISPTIAFPAIKARVVIVSNSQPAWIDFDGSGTVSTNSLTVSETWFEGTNCILANGQSGSLWASPGSYTITMTATDGISTNSGSQTIEILTPGGAVSNLLNYVTQSGLPKKTSLELNRILSKAEQWADKGKQRQAYIELFDLQKKLQSRHDPVSPEIITNLVTGAQEIMNKLSTAK